MFDLKWTWTLLINYFWDKTDLCPWSVLLKNMTSYGLLQIRSYNVVINETDISHDNAQSNMVQKFIFSVLNCC